jgi:hypothetical protein
MNFPRIAVDDAGLTGKITGKDCKYRRKGHHRERGYNCTCYPELRETEPAYRGNVVPLPSFRAGVAVTEWRHKTI